MAHAAKGEPLQTALIEWEELAGPDADVALSRARSAGVTAYRVFLTWYDVAPIERPADFDPENPAHPAYRWEAFDLKIRRLKAYGMEPIVSVNYPPLWAGGSGYSLTPDPGELGRFLRAAARRYSGDFGGLPRIRLWQMWNEANVDAFFSPQFDGETPVSPTLYRRLVNEGAAAVKSVHADNIVIAGGLSPFEVPTGYTRTMAPLRFMRELLCLSNSRPATPTCNERVAFDIWAIHPYTRGGPTHQADNPDDLSLGDIPDAQALLTAAARAGHIVTNQKPRLWVTEFSWDTVPDTRAVPLALQVRWVSEALYRMWKLGISLVTWLQLRDHPFPEGNNQAGLYFRGGPRIGCDPPKLTMSAFRFPFVAFKEKAGISVWGRTPAGRSGQVVVEQLTGKKWKRLASVRTDRFGIFSRVLKAKTRSGTYVQDESYTRRYRDLVVCDGASSYWRLGERSGEGAKDELGARLARYEAGAALGTAGALKSDKDPAVRLNGGKSRVALGGIFSPRTVELWIRTTERFGVIFSNRDANGQGTYIGTTGEGKVVVFDTFGFTGTKVVTDNRWHHVAYTYDGTTAAIYVDGVPDGAYTGGRVELGEPASLGFDATYGNSFTGLVDELAIYPHALAPPQIKLHFTASVKNLRVARSTRFAGSYLRARFPARKVASLPFSLARVPDRPVLPFG